MAAPVFVIMSCTCICYQECFIGGGNVTAQFVLLFIHAMHM